MLRVQNIITHENDSRETYAGYHWAAKTLLAPVFILGGTTGLLLSTLNPAIRAQIAQLDRMYGRGRTSGFGWGLVVLAGLYAIKILYGVLLPTAPALGVLIPAAAWIGAAALIDLAFGAKAMRAGFYTAAAPLSFSKP